MPWIKVSEITSALMNNIANNIEVDLVIQGDRLLSSMVFHKHILLFYEIKRKIYPCTL